MLALKGHGFEDLACVQNKTEVTDAFRGEDLNRYRPIFEACVPVLFNFREQDVRFVVYRPKARMLALRHVYGDDLRVPERPAAGGNERSIGRSARPPSSPLALGDDQRDVVVLLTGAERPNVVNDRGEHGL